MKRKKMILVIVLVLLVILVVIHPRLSMISAGFDKWIVLDTVCNDYRPPILIQDIGFISVTTSTGKMYPGDTMDLSANNINGYATLAFINGDGVWFVIEHPSNGYMCKWFVPK